MASPQKKSPKSQISITSFFKKTPKGKKSIKTPTAEKENVISILSDSSDVETIKTAALSNPTKTPLKAKSDTSNVDESVTPMEISPDKSSSKKKTPKAPVVVVELTAQAREKIAIYETQLLKLQRTQETQADVIFKTIPTNILDFLKDSSGDNVLQRVFAMFLQGRTDTLASLSAEMLSCIPTLKSCRPDIFSNDWTITQIEMELKKVAERVAYGPKAGRNVDPFLDTSSQSLWVWEVACVENYVSTSELKLIREMRAKRRRNGNYVKALVRALELLRQGNTAKLGQVEVKISKFERDAQVAKQRQLAKEKKEKERLEAKDLREKKERERLEAKLAKEELQRQQREEREAEKLRKKQERILIAEEKEERDRKKCKSQSLLLFFQKKATAVTRSFNNIH